MSETSDKNMSVKGNKALEVTALIAVPLAMALIITLAPEQTALCSIIVVLLCLGLYFLSWEKSRPPLSISMPVAVLTALAVAGRIAFSAIPSFKPVSAIAIIGGLVFGRASGFMIGALSALVSNFFLGQGPWTPWQMYAWGLIGYLAGVLAPVLKSRTSVCAFGLASGLIYGLIINSWSIFGFFGADSASEFFGIYLAALPLDLTHGIATLIFLAILYLPWQRKLERIKYKFALEEG